MENPLVQIAQLLISTLAGLYLTVIVLRFLLQLVRADFYNPVSQFVVKATNPLLLPLRKVIPGVFGLDMASIVLALLFHALVITALALILHNSFVPPLALALWSLVGTLAVTLNVFFWGMIIMIVVSWVAPQSYNPVLLLLRQLVEPLMAPFRKILPPMGGLDLSPILAFLSLGVLDIVVKYLAYQVGLAPALVIGI